MTEPWSWKKAFDWTPDRWGKDHFLLIRFAIIIAVWTLVVFGAIWIKNQLFPQVEKEQPTVINSEGAPVDNSTKKTDFTIFKFGGTNN